MGVSCIFTRKREAILILIRGSRVFGIFRRSDLICALAIVLQKIWNVKNCKKWKIALRKIFIFIYFYIHFFFFFFLCVCVNLNGGSMSTQDAFCFLVCYNYYKTFFYANAPSWDLNDPTPPIIYWPLLPLIPVTKHSKKKVILGAFCLLSLRLSQRNGHHSLKIP